MTAIEVLRMAARDAAARQAAAEQYRKAAQLHEQAGYELLRRQMDDWAGEVFEYARFLRAEIHYMGPQS